MIILFIHLYRYFINVLNYYKWFRKILHSGELPEVPHTINHFFVAILVNLRVFRIYDEKIMVFWRTGGIKRIKKFCQTPLFGFITYQKIYL